MKNLTRIVTLLFFLIVSQNIWSQDTGLKQISGIVSDEAGDPVIGASVVEKGGKRGTITNLNGNFTLDIPADATIEISYIGYISQSISIKGKSNITVVLKEDIYTIDELVVTGYTIEKKIDVIGSVSNVTEKSIKNAPVIGIDQALQGRVSGVRITQTTGQPGENISVRIRGVGTINDNDPLYIIDGVPTKDGMNLVSPSDIESITVLKDAASSAIYGARSANGVILVTTKKGQLGKPQVSYNGYVGMQTHGKLIEMADTKGYIETYNQSVINDNLMVDKEVFKRKPIPYDPATLPNINHLEEIFRIAPITNHQISIGGGGEYNDYIVSLGYLNQKGIIRSSDYERFTVRTAINTKLGSYFKSGINVNYQRTNRNIITSSGHNYGVVRYALFRTSAIPTKDENGEWVDLSPDNLYFGDGYNPMGMLDKYDNKEKVNRVFGNVHLAFTPIKNLVFKTELGYDFNLTERKQYWEMWGTNDRIGNPGLLDVNNQTNTFYIWSNTANYNVSIKGNHNLSFLLGHEMQRNAWHGFSAGDSRFVDQDPMFRYLSLGINKQKTVGEWEGASSMLSFFGKVGYDYKGRYYVSGNIRRDGSSRFSKANQFGTFYSAAVGWRIDKEAFFESLTQYIPMLKLRASYGELGNQEIPDYATLSRYSNGYNYVFGNTQQAEYGYAMRMRGNDKLKWESTTQYDIGLDATFFNNQLKFTFDYFHKTTSDMLLPVPLSAIGGSADYPWMNAGSVLNEGIELELSFVQRVNDFSYEIGGNIAFLHNEVLSLGTSGQPILGGEVDNGVFITRTEVGQPIGSFYMLEMDGIFQSKREISTSAYQGENIQPGDVKYVDHHKDNVIDEKDRVFVGSPIPKFTYGFNADFSYKSFDLSLLFQGVYGNKIYMQVGKDIEGFYRNLNMTQRYVDNYWTEDRPSNIMPRPSWYASSNNNRPSTRFLFDGSYLRLKNIQLGYSLPKKALDALHISNCRFYVSAQNLFTITKYIGMEPELTTSANDPTEKDLAAGIDWGTYPSGITYTFGLNINF